MGEAVLYPYASLAVQFKGLHQATLLYRPILRPSQHQPFSLSTPHSLVLPWHTHAQEALFSSYVDEDVFSYLSVLEQGETTFTGRSAAVETLLNSFHWCSGRYKTSRLSPASSDACCLFAILAGLLWRGPLLFVLRFSASLPPAGYSNLAALLTTTIGFEPLRRIWFKLLKVLKCYNFLRVQRQHNCSPAASFAHCVMTLYLLKVHLQTFLSVPVTQKCQILSCDTLVADEQYVPFIIPHLIPHILLY